MLGHAPAPAEVSAIRRAVQSSYRYMEMSLDSAMMAAVHGDFDETASNASTLGDEILDAA